MPEKSVLIREVPSFQGLKSTQAVLKCKPDTGCCMAGNFHGVLISVTKMESQTFNPPIYCLPFPAIQ